MTGCGTACKNLRYIVKNIRNSLRVHPRPLAAVFTASHSSLSTQINVYPMFIYFVLFSWPYGLIWTHTFFYSVSHIITHPSSLLEIRVIIKILTRPFYDINLD